jgi:hypothetical protein
MQAELDELLSLYRTMTEDQKQELVETAKAMLEEENPQAGE